MIIRNSIRQMLRTPVKTFIFFLLLICSGILLTVGAELWIRSRQNLKQYEAMFRTVGTAEQKPSSIRQDMVWDAEKKHYRITQKPQYSNLYPVSVLQLEGVDYIRLPEKRSYYGSYAPEYRLSSAYDLTDLLVIAEFSPVEDCIPDESVRVHVSKLLSGDANMEGTDVWFCDHTNENPSPLLKDKTYVAFIALSSWAHGANIGTDSGTFEYAPIPLETSQYDEGGSLVTDVLGEPLAYYEVVPGFYQTREGKRYLSYIDGLSRLSQTFPVTGTGDTMLLMPFYQGDAYICEGTDISQEEYDAGEKVCLISRRFAQDNALSVGDMVHTRLYYTNSQNPASTNFGLKGDMVFDFQLLNADGETPEIFEEGRYKIVGVYDVSGQNNLGNYQMAGDEMIVPMKSIKNRDSCNILAYGPMKGSTTSFQIPNGSIDDFMEEWTKYGMTDLEIRFYDKGYSELKEGMDDMENMSALLLGVGICMSISLLALYNHLYISRQKRRIAIERCMGVSPRDCRRSLTVGMFLVLMLGSMAGCCLGAVLSGRISSEDFNQMAYDTAYSNIITGNVKSQTTDENVSSMAVPIFGACSVSMVAIGTCMMLYSTNRILRTEPMELIAGSNDTE